MHEQILVENKNENRYFRIHTDIEKFDGVPWRGDSQDQQPRKQVAERMVIFLEHKVLFDLQAIQAFAIKCFEIH